MTTTPKPAPASDEEISRHKHCHRICDGSERCVCGHELSGVTHYALVARIEADRAENDRLRLEAIENAHDYANSLMAHKRKDRELSELRQKLEDMYARVEKTWAMRELS